jgi:hypothetical protein
MINDIESNNKIILGKKFESKSYMLDNLSSYFFESVKSLTYKMITQNRDIDKNFISNSELSYLLQSKLNQEIIINESVYLVRNSLDDVRIRIEKKDQLSLIVQNLEKYDFLSDDIVINEIDKIIYTITENQKKKVAFLKEIEKSDNVLKIVDEDSFLNDILPNIYDDFEVKFIR